VTGVGPSIRAVDAERTTRDPGAGETTWARADYPVCPECGGSAFDDGAVHHELVCGGCGLVVDTHYLDHGPEWRAYSRAEYDSLARTGGTTNTRHDGGMGSTIDWRDRDGRDNALSADERRRAGRLRQWHRRVRSGDASDRTLRWTLGEVGRMASALGVPESIHEVAAAVCQRAESEGLFRGRSVEGVATAALYAACRRGGTPRSLDEVTGVSRVGRREVGRTFKHLTRELGIDLPPTRPREYLARFCSDLGLPESVRRDARAILEAAAGAGRVSGKSPTGYAAGAVFAAALAAGHDPTDRAVADVAEVTPVTVRSHAHEQLAVVGTEAVAEGLVDDGDPPPDWEGRLDVGPTDDGERGVGVGD
jgi:transcription initiation factor TFIIB